MQTSCATFRAARDLNSEGVAAQMYTEGLRANASGVKIPIAHSTHSYDFMTSVYVFILVSLFFGPIFVQLCERVKNFSKKKKKNHPSYFGLGLNHRVDTYIIFYFSVTL